MTVQLTQEQKDRIIPLLKLEMASQSKYFILYMNAKNRYVDLLDTIEDKKYEKEKVAKYEEKIDDYAKSMDIFKKDIELLESIQLALES